MDIYGSLKEQFANDPRVDIARGRGAQGMKVMVKGKPRMVVMFSKGDLLLQLPAVIVSEMIQAGEGEPYDPGTGRPIKDRILIPASNKQSWRALVGLTIESADGL